MELHALTLAACSYVLLMPHQLVRGYTEVSHADINTALHSYTHTGGKYMYAPQQLMPYSRLLPWINFTFQGSKFHSASHGSSWMM